MTPQERLKLIKSDYSYSEDDIRWLISRVEELEKKVTQYKHIAEDTYREVFGSEE